MARILLFCLLAACNPVTKPPQEILSGELRDFITDTLYLEKDYNTKDLDGHMVYIEKQGQACLYNFRDYRLLQYSYSSGELMATQKYEQEGPDGIGTWIAGHLIEADEVFFISNAKELVRADHHGKVVQRYPLPEPPAERMGANYSTMNNNSMFYSRKENKIIIKDIPFVLKEPHLRYENWILKLNLDTGNFEHLPFQYPPYYSNYLEDPELGAYFHTLLWDQEKHLIGFAATDSMLIISNGQPTWIEGKSSQTLEFLPGQTEINGEWTMFLPNNESSRYKWFISDPYQRRILRDVVVGVGGEANGRPYYKKSLILFDEELKRIGEVSYTSEEFSGVGFATPHGLYFPLIQQESDDEVAYARINFPEVPDRN